MIREAGGRTSWFQHGDRRLTRDERDRVRSLVEDLLGARPFVGFLSHDRRNALWNMDATGFAESIAADILVRPTLDGAVLVWDGEARGDGAVDVVRWCWVLMREVVRNGGKLEA